MDKINKLFVIGIFLVLITVGITPALGEISSSDYDELAFEYLFPEPLIENVGDEVDRISMDGLSNSWDFAKPSLPVKPLKILLPMGKTVETIEVTHSDEIVLGTGYNIELGGNLLPIASTKSIKSENTKSNVNHGSENLHEFVGIYYFRGFPILHINLLPVNYNSETGDISYFSKMDFTITTKDAPVSKALRGLSKDFELVAEMVDNPGSAQSYASLEKMTSMDSYDYIIITSNKFKNYNGENSLQDLLDLKQLKGLSGKIVTTEEIMLNGKYKVDGTWGDANPSNPFYQSDITGNEGMFNDKQARIRNLIREAYSEWGTDYVLLAGDADVANSADNIIPLRGLFANESGLPLESSDPNEEQDDIPSDVYYACLDGNFNYDCDVHFGESSDRNDETELDEADLYAEVWVGRACVDSEEEISNFVMKTINYEQITYDPYISNIMFVGEDLGTWYDFYYRWGGEYKDDMAYLIPDQYDLQTFYDRDHEDNNWNPSELYEEILSYQPQIINHDGHGYTNYMLKMGGSTFYEFENEKPFFIYSHSCLTGSFDNFMPGGTYVEDDCVAEILTCEIPYGAFACILNARYGLGSENSPISPSGAYDESFFKALFTENIKELGCANHYSKEDNIWRINDNGFRWAFYQTNLFGDPNLKIKDPNEVSPNKPSKPNGQTNGNVDTEYTYTTSTTDPAESDLYYWFDWGDETNSGWLGPYSSGEICETSNSWESRGNYQIKVKAKNTDEIQSEWSDPLPISMPKTRSINQLRVNLIEKIFEQFPQIMEFLKSHFSIIYI